MLYHRLKQNLPSTIRNGFRTLRRPLIAAAAMMIGLTGAAQAFDHSSSWPDTFTTRLEALALLQSFNAELLSNPSATLTLDRWCASHHLAPAGSKIVAERVKGQDKTAGSDIRALLKAETDDKIAYRRVRLRCGDRILSEADNWYVTGRLTDDMNRQLDTTDTSFGRVVHPLNFSRTTLSAKLLWHPLPEGWETATDLPHPSRGNLDVPPFLLEHRAVLKTPNGTPFSLVVETYTENVLDFAPPKVRE